MPRRPPEQNTPHGDPTQPEGRGFLRAVTRPARGPADSSRFPFSVPVIRALESLALDTPVTFFVGENGSGKSTLLEAIAAAARLPAVGSADLDADATLGAQRELAGALRLVWSRRTTRGFFLRAEDFFGFARRVSALRAEMLARIEALEGEYADRSAFAKGLAMGPARASLAELERRYGIDLDAGSHGQSFLRLFQSRFVPGGLYLLDEPEAPLSPQSQLGLMTMIQEMVAQDAQFVIATHSPILLALPRARIWSFDAAPPEQVEYDDLEHVRLTRDFLNAPERYLRALTAEQGDGGADR